MSRWSALWGVSWRPTCLRAARRAAVGLLLVLPLAVAGGLRATGDEPVASRPAAARIEVTVAAGLLDRPVDGRLLVVFGRGGRGEPRDAIGRTGMRSPPTLGTDVAAFAAGSVAVLDDSAACFPQERLSAIPAGEYEVQAVLDHNPDLRLVDAPGNLFSKPRKVRLGAGGETIRIELTEKEPAETLPPDDEYVRFVRIQSELLSRFHGRPIYLRAGVILPRDFERETERRYPLRVEIGGFGSRYTGVRWMMSGMSRFRAAWLADDAPRMILVKLDGAGPLGDPYQVNSDNNGPYGDAITQELIPHIEKTYRGIGEGWARVLHGGSTGGWVALALQVFYPDYFNGCWAGYPDGVDFRALQLIDIYRDENAYVNRHGFERPSKRTRSGETEFTVRHECQMENVRGRGDSWTMSGGQWGAWNAVYGPRGADGRPVPLWDPKSGRINREAVDHWKKYDLRMVLEENWATLGPKLKGKIHVWVGEADEYFLNVGVHYLDEFLSKASPPYEGWIKFSARGGHGWTPMSEAELLKEMGKRMERHPMTSDK